MSKHRVTSKYDPMYAPNLLKHLEKMLVLENAVALMKVQLDNSREELRQIGRMEYYADVLRWTTDPLVVKNTIYTLRLAEIRLKSLRNEPIGNDL